MVTTKDARHGPEIAYLEDGHNGVVVEGSPEGYARAVTALLGNPKVLQRIREQAKRSARVYTLEQMVENFANGIEQSLAAPRKN